FIFEKEINIHSTLGIKPKIKLTDPDTTKFDIHFFPEGGSLVADVASLVGFKAIDGLGRGRDVKGKIVSSDGDTVAWFESSHLGMGAFSFMPIHDKKYYAVGMVKNKSPFRSELPAALPKGFAMRINNNDTASMMVSISTNQETLNEYKDKELILLGQSYGKTCISAKLKVVGLQFGVKLAKSYFPAGIASIILLDEDRKPYCERLAFIDKKVNYNIQVASDKKTYKGREDVVLKVKALDAQKNPVKTNLSLSVVDANQVPEDYENIVSYFLLQSEVKGNIEKSSLYFDTTNVNRRKQLDLLLLTQGWRDFVWKQLQDSVIRIKYMIEPGITISGRVRQKFINKPIPGANVTMFLAGGKKSTLFTKADSLGRYYIDGVEFYGNKHVIITSSDSKGKRTGWILRDSAIFPKPIVIPYRQEYNIVQLEMKLFDSEADSRKNAMKKYTLSDTIALSSVVISGISQKREKQNQEHYLEGATVDYDFTIGPDDYTFPDVGAFLMFKVPGAQPSAVNPDNASDAPNMVAFRNMGELLKPRFIVDNLTINSQDEYVVYNLTMEQIERILISRSDPMAMETANRNRFVISIFTKPGAMDKKNFFTINDYIDGYYQARVFYAPKYTAPRREGEKPDLRTTIYWNNNVTTDDNGEATVSFSNADKPTKIKVSTQGMTSKGIPVSGTTSYEVK
ncbi:MAG TPA: carboxypeptidase-like regulatory domain-containing protein, partial [Bacteroidales bacterium]